MYTTLYVGIGGVMLILITALLSKPELMWLIGLFFILLLLGIRGFLGEIEKKLEYGIISVIFILTISTIVIMLF